MKAHKALESHFANHWLPWLALYHFLPAPDLRDVVFGMVNSMSRGELTFNELFDEQLTDSDAVSEAWVITPKPATVPLASYLQARIRSLVWNNDAPAFFDPNVEWSGFPVHPSLIEAVVSFGSRPSNESLTRTQAPHPFAEHPELMALAHCIEALSQPASHGNVSEYADTIENSIAGLEVPLRAAALKFAGDYAALEDRWSEAATIYERVLLLLSIAKNPNWIRFLTGLTTVTVQSLATASRVLGGKESAVSIFDSVQERWPAVDPILFSVNASHESLIVHTGESNWPSDLRTSLLSAPLLIGTHDIERPILDFLESDFAQANQAFHSRLRRLIALGSGGETRVTKAVYARSIFSALAAEHQRRRDRTAFSVATCFLIDSGAPKLVSSIDWKKDLVEFYVDDAMIQLVQERSTAFDGVRAERQLLAIELLSGWAMQLSSDASGIAASILRQLAQFAIANEATSNSSTDIAGRSLKALKQIGTRQPEWLHLVSQPVAGAIVARLNKPGWWTGMQEAAETATTYASAFVDEDLASVIEAAVRVLEQLDPSFWVVVRPIQNFITSARAGAFIRADQALERRVVELLLRQGTAQGSDQANLMHYLRTFDARLLEDSELKTRLQEAIEDIKKKAGMVNNSASVTNIQALLSAPTLAGLQGVKVALGSLEEIIKSTNSSRYNVSLPVAYYPLLQITVEHDRIATGVDISEEEFLQMLSPLSTLLENLWKHAANDPTVFVPFSIPPKQVPDPVVVHNWTFVSIQFARLLGVVTAIEGAIDFAAQAQPSIAKAVARAKAIQALSSGEENFDEAKVKNDGKDAFYLNIGSRLSQVDTSSDEGRARCRLLLQMCLQHGPNDLDMAVFIRTQQCGLNLAEGQPAAIATYMARLSTNPDRHLNFLPLLKQLGYKQDLDAN
jgi:hypothetical protein